MIRHFIKSKIISTIKAETININKWLVKQVKIQQIKQFTMGKTSKQLRRNKFGDPKNSRAKQYFRGSTPALAAIPHVDDPLLAILPPPPIPVVAIALPLPIAVDLEDSDEDLEAEGTANHDWLTQHVNRLLISRYYSIALEFAPPNSWHGQGGTIAHIKKTFPSESRKKIKKIVRETYYLKLDNKEYTGERKERQFKGAHLIESGSVHERMVCDLIETGLGLAHTTLLLNEELRRNNKEEVGISCVRELYLTILIRKVAMGTNDAHSPWAMALFALFKQFAISFGVLDPHISPDNIMPIPL